MEQLGLLCKINDRIVIMPFIDNKDDVLFLTIPVHADDIKQAEDFITHSITRVYYQLIEEQTSTGFTTYAKLILPEAE